MQENLRVILLIGGLFGVAQFHKKEEDSSILQRQESRQSLRLIISNTSTKIRCYISNYASNKLRNEHQKTSTEGRAERDQKENDAA